MSRSESILQRIEEHRGLRAIHVVPTWSVMKRGRVTDYGKRRHIGWHLVAVCADGTHFQLSAEDEEALREERPAE